MKNNLPAPTGYGDGGPNEVGPRHIVHVVRDLDVTSGGPSRSVPALARSQAQIESVERVSLVFQDRGVPVTVDKSSLAPVSLHPVRQPVMGYVHLRQVVAELHQRHPIDALHLHGIWSPTLHAVARFAVRQRIPYVVAPRGMLSQWCIGSKSIRKQIAWRWYQFGDLQNALRIHATSAAEAADVAALGVTTAVTVVPNGCDMPPDRLTLATSMLTPDSRWVVSIGRIHPVKRFAELIEAWDRVRPDGWRLLIAGPDEIGHAADLKVQIARLGLTSSVSLRGAVSTQEKWQLLAEADLFALASHSENFGMAIAEALASGTPVLATTGTPWNEINREGCGWWVPPSPDELAEGLRRALQTPTSELQAMGQRGQSLIVRQYAWDRQARETLKMYLP